MSDVSAVRPSPTCTKAWQEDDKLESKLEIFSKIPVTVRHCDSKNSQICKLYACCQVPLDSTDAGCSQPCPIRQSQETQLI